LLIVVLWLAMALRSGSGREPAAPHPHFRWDRPVQRKPLDDGDPFD
jgi:hypothetical protein